MKIGCPTEIKPQEFRVGMTPDAAREAVNHGHQALIQKGAGMGAGFTDADYIAAGAVILDTAEEIFATADMIVKVKEPQAVERKMLREGQLLFTYLHLAPDPEQTHDLLESGCTAIAYETVTDDRGGLPLLAPMSEVAGRLAPQVGSYTLQKANGGRGVLMGGVPGVAPAKVVVIGGGVVGTHAAKIAAGMGADVTILDRSLPRLKYLDDVFGRDFKNQYSTAGATAELVREADMVIGAVLIPGAAAPKLVSRAMLADMKPGAVLVDLAAEGGGNCELTEPGKRVEHAGVTVLGPLDMASSLAVNASEMYAKNLFNLLTPFMKDGELTLDFEDAVLGPMRLTEGGRITHDDVRARAEDAA